MPPIPGGLTAFFRAFDRYYRKTCAAVAQPNSFDLVGTEDSTWKPLVNEKGVVTLESQFTPPGAAHDPFADVRRTLLVLFDPEREGWGKFRQNIAHECWEGWMPASQITMRTARFPWLRVLVLVDEENTLQVKVEIPSQARFYAIPLPTSQAPAEIWGRPGPMPVAGTDGTAFHAALSALETHWRTKFAALLAWPLPHPCLKQGILAGLAKSFISQYGGALRYGATRYYCDEGKCAESFPPTVFSVAEAALFYGFQDEALRFFGYFLEHFVSPSGEIIHRGNGASLSEHGMLLELFARCCRETGNQEFQERHGLAVHAVASRLLEMVKEAGESLVMGCPEDDLREIPHRRWFSSNLWLARGLLTYQRQFGTLAGGEIVSRFAIRCRELCRELSQECEGGVVFVPPCVEPCRPFADMNEFVEVVPGEDIHSLASYTNYRFYPEMLSSGLLLPETAAQLIRYRRARHGDFHGATTFRIFRDYPPYAQCLDDWPLAHLLQGLLLYGEWEECARLLAGHLALHQSRSTFFAPEMSFRDHLDSTHCVPSQMNLPLTVRHLFGKSTTIKDTLCKM